MYDNDVLKYKIDSLFQERDCLSEIRISGKNNNREVIENLSPSIH
jgi:hypothetical protein